MRKFNSVVLVAALAAVLLGWGGASAAATPGERGSGVFCPRYHAYEVHDCRPDHRLPPGALGEQLRWVFHQLGGGAATLTVDEVTGHFTAGHLALRSAEELLGGLRDTLSQAGPMRLVGYSYPPRADQALAIGQAESGQRLAVAIGVASGLIDLLDVTDAPPTLVPHGRYNGWYDIGGRRLFLRCTGSGTPTVVFDNGLTADWYSLQNRLSGLTRVCSYDPARQAGPLGRSDSAPAPRTATDRVNDLHALLAAARVPGPYVLAGHSNGGLFDLLYASRHPEQVAGLVLIDGVHPSYHRRSIEVLKPFVPPEQWPALEAFVCAVPPVQADYEQMDICTAEAQTRAALAAAPLQPMPLAVLSHHDPQHPPGSPDDAQEKLWTQLQNELAALLPGAHHVIAPTSDHDIQNAHPQLVLDEITAVVHAVRAGRTTLAEVH
jgi:pimeloyl-ACP methyl ester carboxylesterase